MAVTYSGVEQQNGKLVKLPSNIGVFGSEIGRICKKNNNQSNIILKFKNCYFTVTIKTNNHG